MEKKNIDITITYCSKIPTNIKFGEIAAGTLWFLDLTKESNMKENQYSKLAIKPVAQFNFPKRELVYSSKCKEIEVLFPAHLRVKCNGDLHNFLYRAEIKSSKEDNSFKTTKGESKYEAIFTTNSNKITKKFMEEIFLTLSDIQNNGYTFAFQRNKVLKDFPNEGITIRVLKDGEEIFYTENERLTSLEPIMTNLTKGGINRNYNANLKRVPKELADQETLEIKTTKLEEEKNNSSNIYIYKKSFPYFFKRKMNKAQDEPSLKKVIPLFYPNGELDILQYQFSYLTTSFEEWENMMANYLKTWDLQLYLPADLSMKNLYRIFIAKDYLYRKKIFFSKSIRNQYKFEKNEKIQRPAEQLCKKINEDFKLLQRSLMEHRTHFSKGYNWNLQNITFQGTPQLDWECFCEDFKRYYREVIQANCNSWKNKLDLKCQYFFFFPYYFQYYHEEFKTIQDVSTESNFLTEKMFHYGFNTLYTPMPIYRFFQNKKVQLIEDKVFIYKSYKKCNFLKKGIIEMFPAGKKFYFFKRNYAVSAILHREGEELFHEETGKKAENKFISKNDNFNLYCIDNDTFL